MNVARVLVDEGHVCDVVALHPPLDLRPHFESVGSEVHHLNLRHRWDVSRAVSRLGRLCRSYDVLHSHLYFASVYGGWSRPLSRATARVVTLHNLGYRTYPPTTPWLKFRKWLEAVELRAADKVVAVSDAVARHYAVEQKLAFPTVIPNGVCPPSAQPNDRKDGVERSGTEFMAVGRLIPEKDHATLIEALARVRSWGLDARLTIIGDGPLRPKLASLIRRAGLDDHVLMRGALTHSDVLTELSGCPIFVHPSRSEGLPLALLEAMAAGCPIVATRVGGIPEVIIHRSNGILVEPGQVEELARGLELLMLDPVLAQHLGRSARDSVRGLLSVEHQVHALLEVYEQAVQATSQRPER